MSVKPDGHVTPDSPFHDLIEEAYMVFKRPVPSSHGTCECCMLPAIKADFFNHSQRDMPLNYLIHWYNSAAVDPIIPKDVWAYLLPRVLDAIASGDYFSPNGNEVALSRFPTGDPEQWTPTEWRVLDSFQRLFLDQFTRPYDVTLDDIICMFANAKWDVNDLFAQVFNWPTERLVSELWKDWCYPPRTYSSIRMTAFWTDKSVPLRHYTSDTLSDRLLTFACDDTTSSDLSDKAFKVADVIWWYSPT